MTLSRIGGAGQALAINAVSIWGVFGARWPVGTAIALYWAENVLRGILILILFLSWSISRKSRPEETSYAFENFTVKQFFGYGLAFNAAHVLFLAVILGVVVPRMSPAQRFEAASFRQGISVIAILLTLELLVWILTRRRTSYVRVQQTAKFYVRRVVVVHLTIVFGMFGLVLFDRPTVLFATFAALKTFVDLGIHFRRRAAR